MRIFGESVQSYRLLLAGGDRLLDVMRRSRHPLGDAVPADVAPDRLAVTLENLERTDISPVTQ